MTWWTTMTPFLPGALGALRGNNHTWYTFCKITVIFTRTVWNLIFKVLFWFFFAKYKIYRIKFHFFFFSIFLYKSDFAYFHVWKKHNFNFNPQTKLVSHGWSTRHSKHHFHNSKTVGTWCNIIIVGTNKENELPEFILWLSFRCASSIANCCCSMSWNKKTYINTF